MIIDRSIGRNNYIELSVYVVILDFMVKDAQNSLILLVHGIQEKSKKWNIDPKKIAISGGSAGGCISAWIATADEQAQKNAEDPLMSYSSKVVCALLENAQTTLVPKVIRERLVSKILIICGQYSCLVTS